MLKNSLDKSWRGLKIDKIWHQTKKSSFPLEIKLEWLKVSSHVFNAASNVDAIFERDANSFRNLEIACEN